MSISRNVYSGVRIPESTNPTTKISNGPQRPCSSFSSGRRTAERRGFPMGQKVVSDLFLKSKQDTAKFDLYVFMFKLLGNRIHDG